VVKSAPYKPVAIEPAYASGGAAAVYNRLKGVVMLAVSRAEIRPKFELIPLMLHEAVPGHHLQFAFEGEPPTSFSFDWYLRQSSAFVEGWATYAEKLGYEMGLYSDPYDRFGQLGMELMRAVRVVIDTGVHAYGWDKDTALRYFVTQTGKTHAFAESEIGRLAYPAGQLSYKVGERQIRSMRERTAKALGTDFELRAFHDTLLRWGSLPLDILERRVDECIAERSCRSEFMH
jgi:uncharacterized protein (DUF885 family)